MKFEDFKSIIERDLELFKSKLVTFEGELGDAMVHPEIKKFTDFGTFIFKRLKIITNGGVRSPKFYRDMGNNYKNLEIMFSIDGLDDETNQKYRRKVNTKKAYENMIAYKQSRFNRVSWQYIIFEHNWFEIPEILDIAKTHTIPIQIKINSRPKFRVSEKIIPKIVSLYERNKFDLSAFVLAN